jgi:hypothetical protein
MRSESAAKRKARRSKLRGCVPITLNLGPIPQENLEAAARVLARISVDKAMKSLGLDRGPTIGDNGDNQHKSGPAGATNTDRAKEQVP